MRYIRTKDGIYDETEHRHTIKNGKVSIMGIFYEFKQADTIEELCDEFVIIRRDDNTFALAKYYPDDKTFYVKTADEEVSLSGCLMYGYEIYGAIWTEWGLKYVAKMNEKGELELL